MSNKSNYINPTLNYENDQQFYEWGLNTLNFIKDNADVRKALLLIKKAYPNCKIFADRMLPEDNNLFVMVYCGDTYNELELKKTIQPIFPEILEDDEDNPRLPLTVLPALSPTLGQNIEITEEDL